jgi:staphylococcal nuclease domain-containing protein 1
MATSNSGTTAWLRGRVKAVPSGDCVVIMAIGNTDLPLEKTITLASIMAPKLVCLHGQHINMCMLHII